MNGFELWHKIIPYLPFLEIFSRFIYENYNVIYSTYANIFDLTITIISVFYRPSQRYIILIIQTNIIYYYLNLLQCII